MTVSSTVGPRCVLAFRVNNVLAQRDVIPDWKLPVGSVGRHDDADDEQREVEQGERVEEVETHCVVVLLNGLILNARSVCCAARGNTQ